MLKVRLLFWLRLQQTRPLYHLCRIRVFTLILKVICIVPSVKPVVLLFIFSFKLVTVSWRRVRVAGRSIVIVSWGRVVIPRRAQVVRGVVLCFVRLQIEFWDRTAWLFLVFMLSVFWRRQRLLVI